MLGKLLLGAFAAATSMVVLASPVLAHGDHDAQPLARHLAAGPFIISLWQIYADAGVTMTPHLIVMFDEGAADIPAGRRHRDGELQADGSAAVADDVKRMGNHEGVVERDVVTVTISDGSRAWDARPGGRSPAANLGASDAGAGDCGPSS